MRAAAAALCAELEDARWTNEKAVARAYPKAIIKDGSVRIPVGSDHCVELLVNYEAGMVLVVFADLIGSAPWRCGAKKGASK